MAYSIRIDRIGTAGIPSGAPRIYAATDATDAVKIAACEVDGGKPDRPRSATVADAKGQLLFTYSGRTASVGT